MSFPPSLGNIHSLTDTCTHTQRLQIIVNVEDRVHVVGDGGDDSIDHVDNAVGGVLVRFDQTSAVHRHNLRR